MDGLRLLFDLCTKATTNCQIGLIFAEIGQIENGLTYWQKGISLFEKAGNRFEAGRHQRNIGSYLVQSGRLSDALLYARAALRNFESYGGRAKDDEDRTKGLIAKIEEAMKG